MDGMNIGQKPAITLKVDVDSLPTIKCLECSSMIWQRGLILKWMSPLQSPSGREEILPIEVLYCKNCGAILSQSMIEEWQK